MSPRTRSEWEELKRSGKKSAEEIFQETLAEYTRGNVSQEAVEAAAEAVDEEYFQEHPEDSPEIREALAEQREFEQRQVGASREHGHTHAESAQEHQISPPEGLDPYDAVMKALSDEDPGAAATRKYHELAKKAQSLKPNDPRRAQVVEVLKTLEAEAIAARGAAFDEKANEAFALAAQRKGEAYAQEMYNRKRDAELDQARDLARRLGPYDKGTVAEREAEWPRYDDLNPAKRNALIEAGIQREYAHVAEYAAMKNAPAPPITADLNRRYSRSEFEEVMRASREEGNKLIEAGLVDLERR